MEPYTTFMKKVVWLGGSRRRHPSTLIPPSPSHRRQSVNDI
jgi:hypothetical protein